MVLKIKMALGGGMIDPIVSVILPIYNGEKYLNESIDSILSQSFEDFELILINDGSTDASLEIAEHYRKKDNRIVLISQENMGLISALNRGISCSKGKYIARMDQDDISLKNRFAKQVEMLDSGCDICGCDFYLISEDGTTFGEKVVYKDAFPLVLMTNVPFAHGSVMIRKDFLTKNKLEYGQTKYIKAEDYKLWCSIFECGGVLKNIPEFLFKYRDVEGSLSSHKKNMYHASMISYEFMKENHDLIVATIKKDPALLIKFKNQISFFSLMTIFKQFGFKCSLFPDFKVFLLSFIRSLKLCRIVIMSKFND